MQIKGEGGDKAQIPEMGRTQLSVLSAGEGVIHEYRLGCMWAAVCSESYIGWRDYSKG